MTIPQELTAEALFKWQADLEANLERTLIGWTRVALMTTVQQALVGDLTPAAARTFWEQAVDQTLVDLDLDHDRFLRDDLLEAMIGDEAYTAVQEVLALRLPADELEAALFEALDLSPTMTAAGIAQFWSEDNWIEQTGTGHLPPYIRDIADALMENGYSESRAIATAVNTVKRWAKKGPARKGGKGSVTAETQAKAIKALLEWEKKRLEAKTNAVQNTEALSTFALKIPDKTIRKWKTTVKRQVRTAFTGVAGRLILGILRVRGVKLKTWVTKRDSRVRPTHRDADGQTVPLEQHFQVGRESLMYPGEHGKAIEEIANCRCIIVPG